MEINTPQFQWSDWLTVPAAGVVVQVHERFNQLECIFATSDADNDSDSQVKIEASRDGVIYKTIGVFTGKAGTGASGDTDSPRLIDQLILGSSSWLADAVKVSGSIDNSAASVYADLLGSKYLKFTDLSTALTVKVKFAGY